MSCGIIIAAAGQGKRMGAGINKQFIELNGKPIIIHNIEKFTEKQWVNEIVVVAHPEELATLTQILKDYKINVNAIVPGGKERQDSIENGLSFINSEFVMIHDGARPFINSKILDELYKAMYEFEAVVLGVPIKDTIKIIDENYMIKQTPERKSLWAIQTPQAFRVSLLKEAYIRAKEFNYYGTDDSSLVEISGIKVKVIEGDYNNIKITTPEDLIQAKAILDYWSEK